MYLRMTGLAQARVIVSCIGAAFGNRQNVVYFLYRCQPSFLETPLAKRMLRSVTVTDAFPRSTVLAIDVRVTLVLVVLSAGYSSVVGAVLSIRKVGTAGIRTWSFRSCWHGFTSYGIVRPACT